MANPRPTLSELLASLRREIEERLRSGEPRASVRTALVAGGLSPPVADALLAGRAAGPRRRIYRAVTATAAFVLLVGVPVGGLFGGTVAAWITPAGPGWRTFGWGFALAAAWGVVGLAGGVPLGLCAAAVARLRSRREPRGGGPDRSGPAEPRVAPDRGGT